MHDIKSLNSSFRILEEASKHLMLRVAVCEFLSRSGTQISLSATLTLHVLVSPMAVAGVAVIAVLQRTLHYDCIVLVKQFRPPINGYCLEFPAGEWLKHWDESHRVQCV